MNLEDTLKLRGWASIPDVKSSADLLKIAASLGRPLRNARQDLVSELRVVANAEARPTTLSATFGSGAFPLHTDTAFWGVPAKYLVMLASGDIRRRTPICSMEKVLAVGGPKLESSIERSLWTVKKAYGPVYTEMTLHSLGIRLGIRFDRQCMKPANSSAQAVASFMDENADLLNTEGCEWKADTAVIISNWFALHGRGIQPQNEQERILQRIYVGER